jgi:hypothetical protein
LEVLYGLIRLFAFDGIGRLSSRLTFFLANFQGSVEF